MARSKLILVSLVALVVALGLGYAWGASGRFAIQDTLDQSEQKLDLAEARGHLLEARVSLYNVNFGDATRHLEEAKAPLRRAGVRYQDVGKNAAAGSLAAAVEHITEAQRLSSKLDQSAGSKANDALEAIRVAGSQ